MNSVAISDPHAPPTEDSRQVLECLGGDADAFEPLVRRYQNAAYATALNYVRNRADAQDIVQDAFVTAYCKLGQLRNPDVFGGWLRRIVVNGCKNWLRRRQSLQSRMFSLDAAAGDLARKAEAEHADRARRMDVWDAVDRLPEHYRTVALMYYLSGLSYREIADFMEVPVSTVRGRLQQARVRLRDALLPLEREGIEMGKIDVADRVQEAVCRIATEQIHEVISLGDTDHVVLYCGVDAEVEVREADGEDVVLEGTKTSIGLSEEAARASMERIQILADRVENYLEAGPHAGEVFEGTSRDNDGRPVGMSGSTEDLWRWKVRQVWSRAGYLSAPDLYPVLREHMDAMPEEVRASLGRATRISVLRKEMEDLVLPRDAYTADVRKVFRPNSTDRDRVHGPVGYANLVLSVPVSKRVTVIRARDVRASGLRASLTVMAADSADLADIEGDVYLFDSFFRVVKGIRGKFTQRFYRFGGADWSDYHARRWDKPESSLESVAGEVDIDMGRGYIEASDLSGQVRIYNRYGTTRLYQSTFNPGDRFHLESCSGEVLLFLKEDLIGRVNLTASTLCGRLRHDPLKDLGSLHTANDQHLMVLSTMMPSRKGGHVNVLEADFFLKTESGDVTLEKMK